MELNQLSSNDVVEPANIRKIDIEYSLNQYKDEITSMIQDYTNDLFGNELKS